MQYLYLIQCKDYYKIGIASDVSSRLASLQTGNPFMLNLVCDYGFDNAEIIERSLHQRYRCKRGIGEWFTLNEKDINDISTVCEMLGGTLSDNEQIVADNEALEDAEEQSEYSPTYEDVKRVVSDDGYHLEYRFDKNGDRRAFVWRNRRNGQAGLIYIGKTNPDYERVKELVERHYDE